MHIPQSLQNDDMQNRIVEDNRRVFVSKIDFDIFFLDFTSLSCKYSDSFLLLYNQKKSLYCD